MVSPLGSETLIGRGDVLARLLDSCASATAGRGSIVVVTGDAGIGKSRLCQEVADRAGVLGFAVAASRCWAHGGAPPLWPWRELLNEVDRSTTDPGPGDERITLSGWPGLTAGFAVFEGAAERLRVACEGAPRLVVLEDLHEADEGTLLLTRFLASKLRSWRVVVLVTIRSGAIAPGSREAFLVDELEQDASVVDLTGLDATSMAELVERSGRVADRPTLDLLLDITNGNPLIAGSVLRAAPPGPLDDTLAAGVTEAFHRRLATVDPAVTSILARAAVLGMTADMDEVRALSEVSPDEVRGAARVGHDLQVLRAGSPHELTFTHDLVRQALKATLTDSELLDAHAAAARRLSRVRSSGEAALRAVRHALEAAPRSVEDRDEAVRQARAAAAILASRDAFSDAAALLQEAIGIVERAGGDVPAVLRIDLAQAMLVAGRVGEAHTLYVAATQAAEAERDAVRFAEAAAGLGGIWINDVRSPVEQARLLKLQRAALDGLPDGHGGLALRLRSRLESSVVFWEGRPVEPLLDVIEDARAFGDSAVLLEVLSNVHTALLGPQWAALRLELADEMIVLAGEVPGGVFALMARCWRAIDRFLIADDGAERSLAELRGPAEALQCLSILYVVRLIETMQSIRSGQLEQAEQQALDAFALGQRCEDADAMSYYGVQVLAIRMLQHRDDEMLPMLENIAGSASVIRGDQGFNAAVAAVAARAGRLDVAQRYLGRVLDEPGRLPYPSGPGPEGLAGLPMFSTWMATIMAVIEAAAALEDAETATVAYDLLQPFAALPVMASLAVVCFGSAHLPLGQAARTSGRIDVAIDHFEAAIEANIRLGHLPRAAMARAALASAMQDRGRPDDLERAPDRWREAIDAGERLGLRALTERWRAQQRGAPNDRASVSHTTERAPVTSRSDPPPTDPDRLTIRREDRMWIIQYGSDRVAMPDRVGFRYLAQLVANPARDIPARDLAGGEPGKTRRADRQPILDAAARESLERRARELAPLIADAREQDDHAKQQKLEDELDAVVDELRRATGLGARDRYFDDDAERARTAVRKALVRAVNDIASASEAAGEHLRAALTTGVECRYDPPEAGTSRRASP